jgi:hypothetical protein
MFSVIDKKRVDGKKFIPFENLPVFPYKIL